MGIKGKRPRQEWSRVVKRERKEAQEEDIRSRVIVEGTEVQKSRGGEEGERKWASREKTEAGME